MHYLYEVVFVNFKVGITNISTMLICFVPIFKFFQKFSKKFYKKFSKKSENQSQSSEHSLTLGRIGTFVFSVDQLLPYDKRIHFDYYLRYFGLIKTPMKSVIMEVGQSQYHDQFDTKIKKFFHFFIKFNAFSMLITFVMKFIIDDPKYLWLIGEVLMFLKGKRYFYNIIMIIFAIQSCLLIILFMDQKRVNLWISNFGSLQGLVPPRANGIHKMKSMTKLLKKYKIMFIISSFQYDLIPFLGFTVFARILLRIFSLKEYIISWMFWNVYYNLLWAYFTPGIIQTSRSYFNVMCYYYKLRLQDLNDDINRLINNSPSHHSKFQILVRNAKLNLILIEINEIFVSLSKSNKFWRRYITIFYYLCNPLICFIINSLIFFTLDSGVIFFAFILLFNTTFTLLQILMSAASINYQAKLCKNHLKKFLCEKTISINFKFKVSSNYYFLILLIIN